jgi:hypothetical protein
MRKTYPIELSDAEWERIESLTCLLQELPAEAKEILLTRDP